MSLASILSITAMMLILGIFFVVIVNVNLFTEVIKQDYNLVEVYMKDDATTENTNQAMQALEKIDGVEKVAYRTKDEALKIMKERWGESGYLLDNLRKNPLPNSILVTITSLDKAQGVITQAKTMTGVENIRYVQDTVDKLTRATDFLQLGSLILMGFMVVISIIVVSNTVKLTVFARKKEIEIMKYIGATNWFIRGPFLTEGIIIGVFAALIASGLTTLIYGKLVDLIGVDVISIISSPLVPTGYMATNLIIIFLALGISIGACGSIVSMRRFLDK